MIMGTISLFKRIVDPPFEPTDPQDESLAVDTLLYLAQEFQDDIWNGQQLIGVMNLSQQQQIELLALKNLAVQWPSVEQFYNVLGRFLNLGQIGIYDPYYKDETSFWARMQPPQ